jgi:hypothetical protein
MVTVRVANAVVVGLAARVMEPAAAGRQLPPSYRASEEGGTRRRA